MKQDNLTKSQKNNTLQSKYATWDFVLLGICILFYLLFPVMDGPEWCADSNGYATMHITREPVYPIFLAVCRGISSMIKVDYLMIAVVLQSLLAAFTTWYAGIVIKKVKDGSIILQIGTVFFQFFVTLLCRFVAGRGSAYTNSILTEGLGLSLFVLFIVNLFLAVRMKKTSSMIWTFILAFLLISLRKQMMIVLPTMCIVFFWYYLIREQKWKKFLLLMVLTCSVLLAGKLFDRTYNYVVRGAWIEHSGNSMGLLCTLLYSSNPENDQNLFTDEEIKNLYLRIMDTAVAQELVYTAAPEEGIRWLTLSTHYADSYDAIGYGIINPIVEGYIADNYDYNEIERALKYDEICGEITGALFRQQPGPLFEVYLYNTWKGFVNSIALAKPILSWFALAAYLGMGVITIYLWIWIRKQRKILLRGFETGISVQDERMITDRIAQIETSLSFAFVTMVGMAVNALVVGLMIFSQPRYMIYGMGLFYTAGSMMLYDVWKILKKETGK